MPLHLKAAGRLPFAIKPSELDAARAEIKRIEAEQKVEAERRAAKIKERAAIQAKIDKDLPALTDKLAAEFQAAWTEAIHEVAEQVALRRLKALHGPEAAPGPRPRMSPDAVQSYAQKILSGQIGAKVPRKS